MFTIAKELQLHHGAPVVHLAVLDKRCAPVRFGSDLGATRVPAAGGSFKSSGGIPHSATMGAVSSSAEAPAATPSTVAATTGATPGAGAVTVGTSAEAPAAVARTGSLTPGRRQKSSTLGARLMGRIGRSATVVKAPHEGPVGGADAAATGGELTAPGHSHLVSADREHNLFVVSEEQMKLFRLPFLVPVAKARITAVEGSRLRHAAVTRFAARSGLLLIFILFLFDFGL